MNPYIVGVIGPGFLNQVPTLSRNLRQSPVLGTEVSSLATSLAT